jgi:hypothetical protein
MTIKKSFFEDLHDTYNLPFDREAFAAEYARSLRDITAYARPIAQRNGRKPVEAEGFQFSDLNAQDSGYTGRNEVISHQGPKGISVVGRDGLRFLLALVSIRLQRAA